MPTDQPVRGASKAAAKGHAAKTGTAPAPFEAQIRPELIENLCHVAGIPLPSGVAGTRMATLGLDVHLATWYHLEVRRLSGLVRSGKRFGPKRVTVSSLIVESFALRLPNPEDYVRLAEAMVRRRQAYGTTTVSVRVPMREYRLLETLADTLPSRKGLGFLSPKAVAEVLTLAWAASNTENPFQPDRAPIQGSARGAKTAAKKKPSKKSSSASGKTKK